MLSCCQHAWLRAGKTRCINHFLINDGWYLVDLPGYGCAPASFGVSTGSAELTCPIGAATPRQARAAAWSGLTSPRSTSSPGLLALGSCYIMLLLSPDTVICRETLACVFVLVDASVPVQVHGRSKSVYTAPGRSSAASSGAGSRSRVRGLARGRARALCPGVHQAGQAKEEVSPARAEHRCLPGAARCTCCLTL